MKYYISLLALAFFSALFISCNSGTETAAGTGADSVNSKGADAHQHTYACPMHPEETGKEGDTCPKCGMKLEHSDAPADATGTYFMQLRTQPATIQPGRDVTLSLLPKKKDAGAEQVALDVTHEKKIHLIVVSDDLSWFDHIHPEFTAAGTYDVTTKFPAPGKYKAFADYKPTSGSHVVDKLDIDVQGTPPAARTYSGDKLSGSSGAYTFELKPGAGKLVTGTPLQIQGILRKNGKEIDAATLENYLGAKAHFVLVSLNEKEFLHVHPGVSGGKFDLHTTIDKPGTYRGWIQFNGDGKIHTIDFTWQVTAGTRGNSGNGQQHESGAHSGH